MYILGTPLWPCWCPHCQVVLEMRVSLSLGLLVCTACGNAFTAAELQEAAYESGYEDAIAEAVRLARPARRRS